MPHPGNLAAKGSRAWRNARARRRGQVNAVRKSMQLQKPTATQRPEAVQVGGNMSLQKAAATQKPDELYQTNR